MNASMLAVACMQKFTGKTLRKGKRHKHASMLAVAMHAKATGKLCAKAKGKSTHRCLPLQCMQKPQAKLYAKGISTLRCLPLQCIQRKAAPVKKLCRLKRHVFKSLMYKTRFLCLKFVFLIFAVKGET